MVPSAFLRVYQPLDAFERSEQLHWERFLLHGPEDTPLRRRYADHLTLGRLGVLAPADADGAEVLHVDGRTFVSPRRMRMRVLAAMASFRESQPIELWDEFVSKKDARRAARDLARLRRRDPSAIAFCHQSPWHVPIRWFVLFHDEERELVEHGDDRWRLRYRTTTRRAIRRAERAIGPLRRSDLGPIGDLILDLHQWLIHFDPASIVELDYASLCDFQRWDELDDDRSAREIHDALAALGSGEYARAADQYQVVLSRWAEVRSRELFN